MYKRQIAALETEIEKSASNYTRLNELMKEKTEKEAQLELSLSLIHIFWILLSWEMQDCTRS